MIYTNHWKSVAAVKSVKSCSKIDFGSLFVCPVSTTLKKKDVRLQKINALDNCTNSPFKIKNNDLMKDQKSIVEQAVAFLTAAATILVFVYAIAPPEASFASDLVISSPVNIPEITASDFVRGLISGASTRIVKELVLHPLDTIRARQQTELGTETESTISDRNFSIWGVPLNRLYDGVLPSLVSGIPSGAIFFGVKDTASTMLRSLGMNKELSSIISVCVANIPYWLIRSPAEVLKTIEQTSIEKLPSSVRIKTLYKQKGFVNLIRESYSTYLPNILYAIPTDTSKFLSYELLTSILFGHSENREKLVGYQSAVAGAFAGMISQIITTPLDVVRTRLMTQKSIVNREDFTGIQTIYRTLQRIQTNEGILTLYKGSGPRILRSILSGSIQFLVYEITQNNFR
jgi:solute carrier family 25 S-adenosylmethionine transporter 26